MSNADSRTISEHRRARYEYFVLETFEAGLVLTGTEVKSLRMGKVTMSDAWIRIEDGQAALLQLHIAPYALGNRYNHDPLRPRPLLLHKAEIRRLYGTIKQDGLSLIPLRLYWKGQHAKLEFGLCRGKKLHDKREAIAGRDARREMERAVKGHGR